jgi:hypothetical protein
VGSRSVTLAAQGALAAQSSTGATHLGKNHQEAVSLIPWWNNQLANPDHSGNNSERLGRSRDADQSFSHTGGQETSANLSLWLSCSRYNRKGEASMKLSYQMTIVLFVLALISSDAQSE